MKRSFPNGNSGKILRLFLFSALVFSAFSLSGRRTGAGAAPDSPLVYVIPVEGEVEKGLSWVVRRGVREAEEARAEAIIIVINTDGGRADATREIMGHLLRSRVPVYSYIESRAFSAGAFIAVATREIYMASASMIGAATPIAVVPGAGPAATDTAMEEKMTSAFRALIASAAEQNGHPVEVVEAMVDRDVEIVDVIQKGKLLTLTNARAESEQIGLSQGTLDSLEEVTVALGFENAHLVFIESTWAEVAARFLTTSLITSLLLMGGLGGIYFEIRSPGFGVPGAIGITCLVLFFFGHYIAGLAGYEEIVIFIIGVVLLAIEIFVTPGFGLMGAAGVLCLIGSFISAMGRGPFFSGETIFSPAYFGALANLGMALVGLVVVIALSYRLGFSAGSPLFGRMVLTTDQSSRDGYEVSDAEPSSLLNKKGRTLTRLFPSGKARIDGEVVDVVSRGEFIEAGSEVEVIRVEGWRVVVRQIKDAERKEHSA